MDVKDSTMAAAMERKTAVLLVALKVVCWECTTAVSLVEMLADAMVSLWAGHLDELKVVATGLCLA